MQTFRNLLLRLKIPAIVGIAGLTVLALGCVLLVIPLQMTSLSNSSKIAKLQCQEAGARLSLQINASADIVRNYSYLIAQLAATELIPKENKREFMLSEMEMRYKNEKSLNNLWCTLEPNVLDGMDAHFINRVGSNELGIFAPWFVNDTLIVSTIQDYVSSFYTIPKETRQEAVTDPYWDVINGERTLMISFSTPIMLNDTFLGVLGTDFHINDLNDLLSSTQPIFGGGKLVTDNGIIVVHDNHDLIGEPEICDCYDIIKNRLLEGEKKMYDEFFASSKGSDVYRVYVPIHFGKIEKPWVYIVEVPANQIYAEARKTVGALFIIFVLLVMSIYFFIKTIEKNKELKRLNMVKDKLFSVVAHDLRSPIGTLTSLLKLISEKILDAETQIQMLKEISKRVDDVFGLLDNLLRWAKSQMSGMVISPVYFDVQDAIRTVLDNNLHDIAADKKITLTNRVGKQEVYADSDLFSVVVRNLTTNAIKYTPEKGALIFDSELSGNMLVVSVKDTGTGMSQEVQDKLFKLSETKSCYGTNNEKGTGLGLILCADFVKANSGKIWFNTKEGEGSTFFFSVPVKGKDNGLIKN